MKKTMKWLGALALMIMCAFAFTACGDDDDENDNNSSLSGSTDSGPPTLQDMLVGNAWYIVYEGRDVVEVNLYLFNANGKADAAELERCSDDGFTKTHSDRFTVDYSIDGDRLTILEDDGDERVAQLDITTATSTTMRPVKSNGTLGDAETSNNYYHEDGSGTWKQEGSKITFTSDEVVSAEFLSYDGTGNAQLSVNFGGKICIYKMERVQ